MNVVSVNAGRAEPMKIGARTITTGIRKRPVEHGYVGALGLAGDVVAEAKHHGGPDQALYLYSSEDYAWWAGELGDCPQPGTFGENLTLSSFGSGEVRIGDRFRVGPSVSRGDRAADSLCGLRDADGRVGWVEALRGGAAAGPSTFACSSRATWRWGIRRAARRWRGHPTVVDAD